MSKIPLPVWTGLGGAVAGVSVGVVILMLKKKKALKGHHSQKKGKGDASFSQANNQAAANTNNQAAATGDHDLANLANLEYVSNLNRAVEKMADYANLDPSVYQSITENADRFAGLVLLSGAKQLQAGQMNKAYVYQRNIRACLNRLKDNLNRSQTPSVAYDEDASTLDKVLVDHISNLNMDVSAQMGRRK